MRKTAHRLLVLLPPLIALGAIALVLAQPSCSASQCKQPERAMGPTPSFECPSGNVCYEGQCRRSCNAGAELVMTCMTSGDCSDSSRPNCISGVNRLGESALYCSSCNDNETCIFELNICEAVADIAIGDAGTPAMATAPLPPAPLDLDGGRIDGFSLVPDGSVAPPPNSQDLTHFGIIEVSQVTDYRVSSTAIDQPVAQVIFFDIRQVMTSSETRIGDPDPPCELRRLRAFSMTPTIANVGPITVETHMDSIRGLRQPVHAMFDMRMFFYVLEPSTLPSQELELSIPSVMLPNGTMSTPEEHFISVSGAGLGGVAGAWPSYDTAYHVPYPFQPLTRTRALLMTPISITSTAPRDLHFEWSVDPIKQSNEGEAVVVEIVGAHYEIRCLVDEADPTTGLITVNSGMLTKFIQLDHPPEARISFGRVDEQRTEIPGDVMNNTAIEATIRFANEFIGKATFR